MCDLNPGKMVQKDPALPAHTQDFPHKTCCSIFLFCRVWMKIRALKRKTLMYLLIPRPLNLYYGVWTYWKTGFCWFRLSRFSFCLYTYLYISLRSFICNRNFTSHFGGFLFMDEQNYVQRSALMLMLG